jgi:CelD/BcsL family acetyltransferase involved in cellulose biosynthesis
VRIDVVETREEFERLEANWNAVYDADPDAQFFLSWKWLSGWLRQIASPWLILAAREGDGKDASYVAFLPLRIHFKAIDARFCNELHMAGNFAADYTGILCVPGFDHLVIPALARQLKQMNWARLHLENIRISEQRYRLLLAHFSKAKFEVQEISRVGKVDGIDNNICPFAPLPGDWNAYLDRLSANTRQKIRRLLKLVDTASEYRIRLATDQTIERDLDTLLHFWDIKWRPRKGELVDKLVRSNRIMLTTSFKAGLLYLPTLWQGDRPLAALATLIDERKRTFLFYMTGRDETFEGPPPGVILHAHSIRHAIANGFAEYDFLRGNEPYKYSFGVNVRRIRYIAIGTRNGLNLSGKLDRRTMADALKESTELHQAGKLAQAERGYRQILEIEPGNADAIHRLGQLQSTRGQHAAAKRLFKTLTEIRPETHKSWLCLAQSCGALGQFREAANAYREVIKLRPDLPEAFTGLGKALVKLDRIREFDVAMAAVLEQREPQAQASERRGNGHRADGRTSQQPALHA